MEPLSQEERNHILSLVTEDQRDFLNNHLKRGRETVFANFMLSEKVHAIMSTDNIELQEEEQDVVDWKIIYYHDFGFRNHLGKCACGRSLRYEFTVQHTKTKKTITYGKQHLAKFLNLNVGDIDTVINNVRVIDNELDELLLKIKYNDYGYEILDELKGKIDIPKDIQEHVDAKVPLLNRHLRRLQRFIRELEKEEVRKRLEADYKERKEMLDAEQKAIREHFETYQKAKRLIEKQFEKEIKEKQIRELQLIEVVNEQLPSNARLGEIAYYFVKNGVTSATEISHLIRNNYHVDKRISSGLYQRPYIYMDVLKSLMHYAEQGYVIFDDESSSIKDCIFYISEEVLEVMEKGGIQNSLF